MATSGDNPKPRFTPEREKELRKMVVSYIASRLAGRSVPTAKSWLQYRTGNFVNINNYYITKWLDWGVKQGKIGTDNKGLYFLASPQQGLWNGEDSAQSTISEPLTKIKGNTRHIPILKDRIEKAVEFITAGKSRDSLANWLLKTQSELRRLSRGIPKEQAKFQNKVRRIWNAGLFQTFYESELQDKCVCFCTDCEHDSHCRDKYTGCP